MGVEYKHYFVVTDVSWIPSAAVVADVCAVLQKWGIAGGAPAARDGRSGRQVKLPTSDRDSALPARLIIELGGTDDADAITKVMGPPLHDSDDLYLQAVDLYAGTDFHIYPGDEACCVEILTPPRSGKKEIAADPADPYVFPAEAQSQPPTTRVTVENEEEEALFPKEFTGVWRAAVIIDCGKCVPGFARQQNTVPGDAFTEELTAAFGAPLHQVGMVY